MGGSSHAVRAALVGAAILLAGVGGRLLIETAATPPTLLSDRDPSVGVLLAAQPGAAARWAVATADATGMSSVRTEAARAGLCLHSNADCSDVVSALLEIAPPDGEASLLSASSGLWSWSEAFARSCAEAPRESWVAIARLRSASMLGDETAELRECLERDADVVLSVYRTTVEAAEMFVADPDVRERLTNAAERDPENGNRFLREIYGARERAAERRP